MRVTHRTQSLITARKFHFLALVGCTGTNDRHNSDKSIDVLHVAHFAERDHGRAFNMMHSAGVARRDQAPDFGIIPGTHRGRKAWGSSENRIPQSEYRNLRFQARFAM